MIYNTQTNNRGKKHWSSPPPQEFHKESLVTWQGRSTRKKLLLTICNQWSAHLPNWDRTFPVSKRHPSRMLKDDTTTNRLPWGATHCVLYTTQFCIPCIKQGWLSESSRRIKPQQDVPEIGWIHFPCYRYGSFEWQ